MLYSLFCALGIIAYLSKDESQSVTFDTVIFFFSLVLKKLDGEIRYKRQYRGDSLIKFFCIP